MVPHDDCSKASTYDREFYGCNLDGKALHKHNHLPGFCPIAIYRSAFFQSLDIQIKDYRRGALGNVHELPVATWHYLRFLDRQLDAREGEWIHAASKARNG